MAKRDEIEPLSAERSRIHVNVSREFLKKLKTARAGLSHAIPGATMEQASAAVRIGSNPGGFSDPVAVAGDEAGSACEAR